MFHGKLANNAILTHLQASEHPLSLRVYLQQSCTVSSQCIITQTRSVNSVLLRLTMESTTHVLV